MNYKFAKIVVLLIYFTFCSTIVPLQVLAQEQPDELMAPFQLNLVKSEIYPVDLGTVLNIAVENNLPLQISSEQEKIDRYDLYSSYSAFLPDVTPSFNQSRMQGVIIFGNNAKAIFGRNSFAIYKTTIEPQVTLDYTLFAGGETIYRVLMAKRQLKATQYSISDTKDRLLLAVSNAYYDLQLAYKSLDIAQKEVEDAQAILNLNNQRLNVGVGTILDVSQSEDQLARSKHDFIEASKNILKASQNLNQILNLPLELNIIPISQDINKITLTEEKNINNLLNLAFENRPDLKQAKELKRVLEAQKGIARSQFFPKLTFTSYINGTGPTLNNLSENRFAGYAVQLNFLKNLGVNYLANYRKSNPMLKQADLQIEQKIREIETEIVNALLDIESSDREISISQIGLKASEDSFKYATARLESGVGTNLDVLSAQVALTTARTSVVNAVISFNKSQISLLRSIGLITIDKILGKEPVIPQKD